MRFIDKIILHCADTRTNQNFSVDQVRDWHLQKGWSNIGYHYYIKLNGSLYDGRPISQKGAHCKGYNYGSVGICLEGGNNDNGDMWDKPTESQISTLKKLVYSLRKDYGDLTLHGHYEFSKKTCPNFDVCILNL